MSSKPRAAETPTGQEGPTGTQEAPSRTPLRAVKRKSKAPSRQPDLFQQDHPAWSPEETLAAEQIENGLAAVVSMRRKAPYGNVLRWARERDLLERIDRATAYGNPFVVGRDGTLEEVIEKYARRLLCDSDRVSQIRYRLRGKCLACWCAPGPCHGDVLAAIVNCPEERFQELLDTIREKGWAWTRKN